MDEIKRISTLGNNLLVKQMAETVQVSKRPIVSGDARSIRQSPKLVSYVKMSVLKMSIAKKLIHPLSVRNSNMRIPGSDDHSHLWIGRLAPEFLHQRICIRFKTSSVSQNILSAFYKSLNEINVAEIIWVARAARSNVNFPAVLNRMRRLWTWLCLHDQKRPSRNIARDLGNQRR